LPDVAVEVMKLFVKKPRACRKVDMIGVAYACIDNGSADIEEFRSREKWITEVVLGKVKVPGNKP
jgi:hypothetical protein